MVFEMRVDASSVGDLAYRIFFQSSPLNPPKPQSSASKLEGSGTVHQVSTIILSMVVLTVLPKYICSRYGLGWISQSEQEYTGSLISPTRVNGAEYRPSPDNQKCR